MKRIVSILLSLILIFIFTACQSGGGTTTAPTENKTETPDKQQETQVTESKGGTKEVQLLTWANEPTVNYFKSIAEGFTKAYPEYSLVITDVPNAEFDQVKQTRVSAGNVDIMCFQQFSKPQEEWNKAYYDMPMWQQFIEEGLVLDLTDYPFMKNYSEKALKDNSYNGRNYCVPTATVAYNGLFYNKKIFEELNLKIPETWDEFITLCETIKATGKYGVITVGGADQWPLNMFANGIMSAIYPEEECKQIGKDLLLGNIKHTDEKILKVYQCMDQFASYLEPGVAGILYQDVPGRFVQGNIAMLASGTFQAPYIEAVDPNFEFDYFPLPGFEKRSDGLPAQFAIKYDLSFCVATNAPNQEGALKFLEYFSQKDIYTAYLNATGFCPTQEGVTLDSPFMNSLADNLQKPVVNYEHFSYTPKGVGEYGSGAFSFFYLKTLGGPFTYEELAQHAAEDFEAAIAAAKKLK